MSKNKFYELFRLKHWHFTFYAIHFSFYQLTESTKNMLPNTSINGNTLIYWFNRGYNRNTTMTTLQIDCEYKLQSCLWSMLCWRDNLKSDIGLHTDTAMAIGYNYQHHCRTTWNRSSFQSDRYIVFTRFKFPIFHFPALLFQNTYIAVCITTRVIQTVLPPPS